ncbi:YkvI family membrane protein [Bacillus massiliglaciei]|uniref:YkvI family membrane protein n=1 Tax=Bacillus massiliglaciei TaxID=1816693 RepID=UPI000A6B2DEF|nr:hypothetical protein [Bacillus massiliglaciei]
MLSKWSGAFQVAAVYVGTIVGAGFATGKEIVEFFTRYGFFGFLGILIAGFVFIYAGTKIMLVAKRIEAESYEELNCHLFGRKIGTLINILFFIMLIGVTAVMISGAGAIFHEQLGMSRHFGMWFTIILAALTMVFGVKGLFAVNTFVVPVMIGFSLTLCVLSLGDGFFLAFFSIPEETASLKMFLSPFSYTAFNLALSQAVLVPLAKEIKEEETIRKGAVLGGVFLTIILLSGHLALIALPEVMKFEIPTAFLMKAFAPGLYGLFILVIFGEIFTSVVGNLFGLGKQAKQYIPLSGFIVLAVIVFLTFFIREIGYGKLLGGLYPLFGYISMIFLFLVWKK